MFFFLKVISLDSSNNNKKLTNMKFKHLFYLLIAWSALGCNDMDDGPFVEPITLYEKVNGNWSLESLKMIDEVAKANAESPSEQNISSFFNFSEFKLSLNVRIIYFFFR